LVLGFGHLPTFVGLDEIFGHFCERKNRVFGQICGHLPGFCPLLKSKVATQKPSVYAGLRAFCPLSHFFLLISCDKKFIYL
jgi:hypothetical protein